MRPIHLVAAAALGLLGPMACTSSPSDRTPLPASPGGAGGTTTASGGVGGSGGGGGGLPAGECRSRSECSAVEDCVVLPFVNCSGEICTTPGGDPLPDSCASDADCTAQDPASICGASPCCGELACIAGCNGDSNCKRGEACGADRHCAQIACVNDADCGDNLTCIGGGCMPKGCTTDADCSADYCVAGTCSAALGVCKQTI